MQSHIVQTVTTLAGAWRVVRRDAAIYGWTEADTPLVLDGITYLGSTGLSLSSAHSTNTFAVDTLDVTAFLDAADEAALEAGIWDGAVVTNFYYNWADPPSTFGTDCLVVRHGTLGVISRQNTRFTAEIRGLAQALSQRIGRLYSPSCPWRHALWDVESQLYVSSVECGIDLSTRQQTGTVTTGSADGQTFADTGNAQAADYYAEGIVTFTSGANLNLSREVRLWTSPLFTLHRPFPLPIVIGDAYAAVIGDDKTYATCRNTFDNLAPAGHDGGYGGFEFVPGQHQVFAIPVRG